MKVQLSLCFSISSKSNPPVITVANLFEPSVDGNVIIPLVFLTFNVFLFHSSRELHQGAN